MIVVHQVGIGGARSARCDCSQATWKILLLAEIPAAHDQRCIHLGRKGKGAEVVKQPTPRAATSTDNIEHQQQQQQQQHTEQTIQTATAIKQNTTSTPKQQQQPPPQTNNIGPRTCQGNTSSRAYASRRNTNRYVIYLVRWQWVRLSVRLSVRVTVRLSQISSIFTT